MQSESLNPGQTTRSASTTDPLAILLKEMMPELKPSEDLINALKYLLSRWGGITSTLQQYQVVVAQQRAGYQQRPSSTIQTMNTSSAVSKRESEISNWHSGLRKISFSDLVLFQTSKGCYIEGLIVGEPIQPMVGGTTLIREAATHQMLMVCFYNVLPDGIFGSAAESLLKAEFPMGLH